MAPTLPRLRARTDERHGARREQALKVADGHVNSVGERLGATTDARISVTPWSSARPRQIHTSHGRRSAISQAHSVPQGGRKLACAYPILVARRFRW